MSKLSPNKYFRSLFLLYTTFVFVQLIFILAALYLRTEGYVTKDLLKIDYLRFIVPLVVLAGLYEGNVFYKKRLKTAREKATLAKKLRDYRLGLVIQYILWIVPSLFAIASFVIKGNWIYLAFSGVMILAFLLNRPGMNKARKDLEL